MGGRRAAQQTLPSLLQEAEGARRLGLLGVSRRAFLLAARRAIEAHDTDSLVTAALGIGGFWVNEHRDVVDRATVRSLWLRARDAAAVDSLEHARLSVREAAEAVYEGAPTEAVEAAVERVRSFGDDVATAEALSLLHHVRLGPSHARTRLAVANEIIDLAAAAGSDLLALMGLCWRTIDLFLLGDVRAPQCLSEFRERSERSGCEAFIFLVDVLDAMLLARRGRLEEAEQTATKALERGTSAGDPDAAAYYGAMLTALRWWQGRASEVLDFARELAVSPRLGPNDHVYVAADAFLSATEGDLDASAEAITRLRDVGLAALPDSSTWLTTQFLLVEAAFLLGDGDVATEAADLISPFRNLPVMPSLAVVCLGSATRSLGIAAAAVGDLDAAVTHLEAAIRTDRSLRSRPMMLVTEHTLTAVLRARGRPGDSERADSLGPFDERAERMGLVLPRHPEWLVRAGSRRAEPPQERVRFTRVGQGWSVEVNGRTTVLPDLVGFTYLARLLREPGKEIEAVRVASPEWTTAGITEPVLDEVAMRQYRRRIEELNAIVSREDLPSSAKAKCAEELTALRAMVTTATDIRGMSRSFPVERERARTAVRKAIVRAIECLAAVEPELASHLELSVETGARCRYTPAPRWSLTVRVVAGEGEEEGGRCGAAERAAERRSRGL